MVKLKMATTGTNVSNGKKQSKGSLLKLQHLENLSVWSGRDPAVLPSMAAFFGRRFAACGEALGVPPDDSVFTCERCETILQPGYNCTVRIEKNKGRKCQRRKEWKVPTQNNVVYTCHFCSHPTVKRGTLKGHMKRICPPKDKPTPKSKVQFIKPEKCTDTEIFPKENSSTPKTLENLVTEPFVNGPNIAVDSAIVENLENEFVPDTPAPVIAQVEGIRSLLDTKKRNRNKPGSKKDLDFDSAKTDITGDVNSSKKRKKKTWTSLKDMVKSSGGPRSKNLPDITIPFFL